MNVLITGASSGIGKALSDRFLENNYQVFALDICDIDHKDNLVSFKADIRDKESLLKIKEELTKQNVQLDFIVNVAGIHMMASLVESDFDKMKRLIDINLTGTMLVNHTFHNQLKEKGAINGMTILGIVFLVIGVYLILDGSK